MKNLALFFVLLFGVFLSGCGGSDSGSSKVVDLSASIATDNSRSFAISNDAELTIQFHSEDDNEYKFTILGQPENGLLTGEMSGIDPVVLYKSNADFVGSDFFEFEVADSAGNISTGIVTITVLAADTTDLDTDGDGITDIDEINLHGTSPLLADTDADGFSDFREIFTYGFDATVNNFRFNPLIADIPQIDVRLSSAPVISLNYTEADGTSTIVSTSRSQSSAQTVANSTTREESSSFEHSHTFGQEVGLKSTVSFTPKVEAHVTLNWEQSSTWGQESSSAWTEEQSEENTTALENGEEFEDSHEITTSGGGVSITVEIVNGGHISYTLENLFLSATYLDLTQDNPVVPIGNLAFDNSRTFPSFTLVPGEQTVPLNFITNELGIDPVKMLLADSQGLVIRPAIYEMLDEDGVSYNFNSTGMQAQDATVLVDFAGIGGNSSLLKMVATNADPSSSGISVADLMAEVLKLNVTTDTTNGFIESISGVNNNEPNGYWVMVHAAYQGEDEMITHVYTTPTDEERVLSINSNVSNLITNYDLSQIQIHGGDILHVVYLIDDDQDGLGNRQEFIFGTDPDSADTDSDGLTDQDEINGWEVAYTEKTGSVVTFDVTSNPLQKDSDDDGVKDVDEANLSVSDSQLKRNPRSADTDGDGLKDGDDDLDSGGVFLANVFDNIDLVSVDAALVTPTTLPSLINVSYEVRDVTEQGAGVSGNGIDSYQVYIYRHIATDGNHPDPTQPPIDFYSPLPGSTITCGTDCDWTLVNVSADIPGAITISFDDDVQIDVGEDFKYIAYMKINGRYNRSALSTIASAEFETVTIHMLPGKLTNVRTIADPYTLLEDYNKVIRYSAFRDAVFYETYRFFTIYGDVYDASNGDLLFSDYPYDEPSVIGGDWLFFAPDSEKAHYPFDILYLTHPLGAGDAKFHLNWLLSFDGKGLNERPVMPDAARRICGTFDSRLGPVGGMYPDPMPETDPSNMLYTDANDDCTTEDAIADGALYPVDVITGGATFSINVPAQAGCHSVRFTAYEYDYEFGGYNKVAYPVSGEEDYANIDEAELCRDENGVWELKLVQLEESSNQSGVIHYGVTAAGNVNLIEYQTRPLAWDNHVVRVTKEGILTVNYKIEVQ